GRPGRGCLRSPRSEHRLSRTVTQVYLGLGSNIDPAANLRLAVTELQRRFWEIELSPVYSGPAIGFEGDDFLNMVVGLQTALSPRAILDVIADLHRLARRERGGDKLGPRTLDIDLLLYGCLVVDDPGQELPRPDVLQYAFVLRPLADIAAEFRHPSTGRTIGEHWHDFDAVSQPLQRVEIPL
ncbi:MAG TPA: 2-amino-4-hydroxy-6-hydroxymethyldihydropteridine diphosphokinase, partial [Woeseiaceae bacterium]|nr:2-amino-4-hydroxy-6-hydroxymethyldihydropteridine diphosphokinase [Woeseiaceae bacterium]